MLSSKHLFSYKNSQPFNIYLTENAPLQFSELNNERFKIVAQLSSRDMISNINDPKLSKDSFIPFIKERDGLGRIVNKVSGNLSKNRLSNTNSKKTNDQSINNKDSSICSQEQEIRHIKWLKSKIYNLSALEQQNDSVISDYFNPDDSIIIKPNAKKIRNSLLKRSVSILPPLGYYQTQQVYQENRFPKTKNIILCKKEFNAESINNIYIKNKKALLIQKKQNLNNKLKLDLQVNLEEIEKKQLKKQDTSCITFPRIIQSQKYVDEIINSNCQLKSNLQLRHEYTGFPKDFVKNILQQKRNIKILQARLENWGQVTEEDRLNELKALAKELIQESLREQEFK